jgi:hypothetical protein
MTITKAKLSYTDALDADEQVTAEELIAARIFDTTNGALSEEMCQQLGRDLLLDILAQFRSDLVVQLVEPVTSVDEGGGQG